MEYIDLDSYGMRVVDFQSIFTRAYKHIVNDLFVYDKFHDYNVRSQDTKKIYYYHTIKQLCDDVISMSTDNKIIVYYCEKDIKCDFKQVTNKKTRQGKPPHKPDFVLFMNRFFKQIKRIVPIRVYVGTVKFNTFIFPLKLYGLIIKRFYGFNQEQNIVS